MPPPLTNLNNLFCSNLETKILGDLADAIPNSGETFSISFASTNPACVYDPKLINCSNLPSIISGSRSDVKTTFSSHPTSNFTFLSLAELLADDKIGKKSWPVLKNSLPPQPPDTGSITKVNLCNYNLGNIKMQDIASISDFTVPNQLNLGSECVGVNAELTNLPRLTSILSAQGVSIADVKETFETSPLTMNGLNNLLRVNPTIEKWSDLKLILQMPDRDALQSSTTYPQENKNRIKEIINVLYTNYLFDNKEIVRFLSNIDNIDSGNVFEQMTKRIMSLKVPYYDTPNDKYIFLRDNGDSRQIQLNNYKKMLFPIIVLSEVLKNIVENNLADYKDKYSKIDKVEFTKTALQGGKEIVNNSIKYSITSDTNTLQINVYAGDYKDYIDKLEYDKYTYRYNSAEGIDRELTVKNFIHFLMRFEPYNLLSQLYVFYYILKMIEEYFKFYKNAETIIQGRNIDDSLCDNYFGEVGLFKKYQQKFNAFEVVLDTRISTNTANIIGIEPTNFYVSKTCPMTIKPSDDMWIDKSIDLKNDYVIVYNNTEYTINDAFYADPTSTDILNQNKKKVTSLIVNAKANNADGVDCANYIQINIDGIDNIDSPAKNTPTTQFSFKLKTMDNLKSDYGTISGQLEGLNDKIARSRDKINKQVKSYTARKDIIKSLDLRQNIYYVVFGIIGVIILVLLLVDVKQSVKVYSGFFIALVLLTMNVINYYMKYDYIEHFVTAYSVPSATGQVIACTTVNSTTPQSERVRFINQHIPTFTTNVYEVLEKVKTYASSANTQDIFKKISTSLKEEKDTFEKHAENYKYKEDANKKSIENMKHEMISKSGFINLLSISSFVIVLIYVLYVVAPSYINVYLTVGIILILINMSIYYLVILHPVRTKARNKYWSKPSKSTVQRMS
jgi:hypothetical protein